LLPPRTVKVDRTEEYPGHIACDSASQSEIVVPITVARSKVTSFSKAERQARDADRPIPPEWSGRGEEDEIIIGVLDIDCEAVDGFDEEDVKGLEAIVKLISQACEW
jgi:L-methionine (R)-S-oxide reductase